MTLQELLNADIGAVGEWIRQGFVWWIGELAQMVPERLKQRGGRAFAVAELGEEGAPARIWRAGRFTEVMENAGGKPWAADLALPPGAVLCRGLTLPALGVADLKRLVALDIDRLTPFRAEQVYFDIALLEREPGATRQPLMLGVIPRADAEAALERAQRHAITPRRMGMAAENGLRFDFLSAIRAAGRGGRPDRRLAYWWVGVLVLAALNLAVLVFKDVHDLDGLRATIDLQRPTAALAQGLRRRVGQEAASRAQLLTRRAHNEPLRIIDAVTRAFPGPQWVQRLEWNGHSIRIVGYRNPGFDVIGAVRAAPALGAPRELNGPSETTPGAQQQQPFDVIAEPDGDPRR